MNKIFNRKKFAKAMAAVMISGAILSSADMVVMAGAESVEKMPTATIQRTATKNGLIQENGKWYYYKDGKKQKGWVKDGDKTYYLLKDYTLATKMWRTIDGKKYYFKADGDMVKSCFREIDGKIYRFFSDGTVSPSEVGKITGIDKLNVWSSTDSSKKIVTSVKKNDCVEIKETKNGWHKVVTEDFKTGWVKASYVTIPGDKISKVIDTVMDQMGKPYRWGATGPSSFDCSGLMYYSFKKGANKTIPRTSREQSRYGKKVSKSELQPGDLVFFGSGNSVSHVGMYIGDDKYVHAPQTGDVVKISKLSSRKMITARRIEL